MSLRPDNTLISNREMLLELVAAPIRAIGSALVKMSMNSARARRLEEIAAIPEEELRARGLTHADLICQAFRHDG